MLDTIKRLPLGRKYTVVSLHILLYMHIVIDIDISRGFLLRAPNVLPYASSLSLNQW